ncbi:MAG: hypothetical protein GHCLOJNM_03457 [bacterium]|nr:hypothetical protein [bacterium]
MRRTIFSLLILVAILFTQAASAQTAKNIEKGFEIGDGNIPYNTPYNPKSVREVTFVSPTAAHPYYEIAIPLGDWTEGTAATVKSVSVNGVSSDSYYVFVDGFSHVQSGWITNKKPEARNVLLVTRSLWHDNEEVSIRVEISATAEDGSAKTVEKNFTAKSPKSGGGPVGWRRYQSFVAREKAGIERRNEPVEFSVTVRAEDCADLGKELRLCEVRGKSGELKEIPFQVFNAHEYPGTPPGTHEKDYLQHPSRSVEVAFLASVPAKGSTVYAVFHDNPEAGALAPPETDLRVSGPALGATVETDLFRVLLSEKSGQIAAFELKKKEAPRLTNSLSRAVHWNPDSFSDRGYWGHTFSWDPPDHTEVTTRGPILFRITNRGRMPEYTPEVDASVTYSIFAGSQYVLATSVMEVRDPLNASAIRNGEVVLDSHLITHFVWKEKDGGIETIRTLHGPNWQDEWAYRVDHDVPWIAMTNELDGFGVGAVVVNSFAYNPLHGNATEHRPAYYLYYHHFWSLPLTYFTRGWVYPFSDYQRGPILTVKEGSTYIDRTAFMPFALGKGRDRYREIDEVSRTLANPLEIRWGR